MTPFKPGTPVRINDGAYEGLKGTVLSYEESYDLYLLHAPSLSDKYAFGAPSEIVELDLNEGDVESSHKVPGFGMTGVELAGYADQFIESVLGRMIEDGNNEHGKQGFQDWEADGLEATLEYALDYVEGVTTEMVRMHVLLRRLQEALPRALDKAA